MISTLAVCSIEFIEARIAPLRAQLTAHPLYRSIQTQAHVRGFMESHVFAVWDFMSLLKALQAKLTCVATPWVPTAWPQSRRFINEIVLGEESDLYEGRSVSHFELYLEAMGEAAADTAPIRRLIESVQASGTATLDQFPAIPPPARVFVGGTMELIASGKVHEVGAAFTFGREDVIPDLFRELVRDLDQRLGGGLKKFIWYLERHIEVDGEDHGPLALRMIADLCGDDERLWEEAANAAEAAIRARLSLWDGIVEQIS